jgi:hypothetical protein
MTDLFGTVPTEAAAAFSPDRRYRYSLLRRWGPGQAACFVMLNPSTADETEDDPTIRRCMGFAQSWGYDALVVGNLFAFRATDPNGMLAEPACIGPENDTWLRRIIVGAGIVVCAWGANGTHLGRGVNFRAMASAWGTPLFVLGLTLRGEPRHPLYLPADLKPVLWK